MVENIKKAIDSANNADSNGEGEKGVRLYPDKFIPSKGGIVVCSIVPHPHSYLHNLGERLTPKNRISMERTRFLDSTAPASLNKSKDKFDRYIGIIDQLDAEIVFLVIKNMPIHEGYRISIMNGLYIYEVKRVIYERHGPSKVMKMKVYFQNP